MYQDQDFVITENELQIRKDRYQRRNIRTVEARHVRWYQHLVRIILFSLAFSAVGWALPAVNGGMMGLLLGLVLMLLGAVIGAFGCRPYELRAEFNGNSETGPQWVTLARGWRQQEMSLFTQAAQRLASAR